MELVHYKNNPMPFRSFGIIIAKYNTHILSGNQLQSQVVYSMLAIFLHTKKVITFDLTELKQLK